MRFSKISLCQGYKNLLYGWKCNYYLLGLQRGNWTSIKRLTCKFNKQTVGILTSIFWRVSASPLCTPVTNKCIITIKLITAWLGFPNFRLEMYFICFLFVSHHIYFLFVSVYFAITIFYFLLRQSNKKRRVPTGKNWQITNVLTQFIFS